MSDNSNNVHFSGVRFICSPYLAIKSALASLAIKSALANESYALKMNIIVILAYFRKNNSIGLQITVFVLSQNTVFLVSQIIVSLISQTTVLLVSQITAFLIFQTIVFFLFAK